MNLKLEEIFAIIKKREDEVREEQKNTVLIALAVVGAVLAVVGIAFLVYRHFSPDYLEDFEDDFDDDFDDYFEEDEEAEEPAKEEEAAEE